eukprot:COSAG01_NODE_64381_length_276_cov_2.322034_1_plen_51_part_01
MLQDVLGFGSVEILFLSTFCNFFVLDQLAFEKLNIRGPICIVPPPGFAMLY